MQLTRKRLPKPAFDVLEKAYLAGKAAAHLCPVATPVDGGLSRDEWATRLCEAILVATQVVPNRSGIAASNRQLLADYSFGLYGRMCPHGVGLEADALSKFFLAEWGEPLKLAGSGAVSSGLQTRTGILFFAAPRGSRAHVDLWDGTKCLGRTIPETASGEVLFWELKAASGGSANQGHGGGSAAVTELARKLEKKLEPIAKPEPVVPPVEEKHPLRLEYEAKVRGLKAKIPKMRAEGFSNEQIARALHAERRELGVEYKDITPPAKREEIYQRNIKTYGDKLGPSIEQLRQNGKSWVQIMESACRPGGKDLKFGK